MSMQARVIDNQSKCRECCGSGHDFKYIKGTTARIPRENGYSIEISKMKKIKCPTCKGKGFLSVKTKTLGK